MLFIFDCVVRRRRSSNARKESKTIEEDGLEICTKGMHKPRTVDEYVQAWRNQI